MAQKKNLTGQTFGRLFVLDESPTKKPHSTNAVWRCRCVCGNTVEVRAGALISGNTKGCGCTRGRYGPHIHRKTHTREWRAWIAAKRRCDEQVGYVDRGITMWPEWRASFQKFLADVGLAPSDTHQLDRIDNDGGYAPGNVRWATPEQQANNKRNNRRLTLNGETHTLAEWARLRNVPRERIKTRLERGWSVFRALTEPFVSDRREIARAAATARWRKPRATNATT